MALQFARDDALVFGDIEGSHRNPEHTSRQFVRDVTRCRVVLGADNLPVIRTHDLRHTHATLLMKAGVHPKVASERLGHADISLTLSTYSHVLPQMQEEAAEIFSQTIARKA